MTKTDNEKILNLFYSGEPANDLIALEIIKHISECNVDVYIPSIIVSVFTANNQNDATFFLNFLEPHLITTYIKHLERIISIQSYTWKEIKNITDKERRKYLEEQAIYRYLNIFETSLQTEIIFTLYERTKSEVAIYFYLKADQGKHFARKEIFKNFLTHSNGINSLRELKIPGLFPDEIEAYLERVYPKISNEKSPYLIIEGPKSQKAPDLLFNKKFEQVHIDFLSCKAFFPNFIFRFQGLKKLILEIDSETQIPENWNSLSDLEELELLGDNHVFKNFNFVNSLIKLKSLTIHGHYISDPGFLLSNIELPIIGGFGFKSIGDFSSYADEKTFLLPKEEAFEIASALGRSYYLSLKEKKYFFKKIIKHKKLKELETLSIDELIAMKMVDEHIELKNLINEQIETLCNKQKSLNTLDEKSLLYIAGNPEYSLSIIEKQLTDLKIPFYTDPHSTPFEDITHLVLYENEFEYKQIQGHQYKLISEKALLKHLGINENDY